MAPETAAHAAGVAAMLPMITLGIPGSPTAAVMLGGLIIWGLQPGPMLFKEKPDFVWGLIACMYTGNIIGVLMVLAFVPLFAAILRIPFAILTPLIVVVCAIGSYAVHNSMIDVWYMLIFGVVGYVFKKLDYPLAPLVLALVLGDLAENALRQSLIMSQGSLADLLHAADRRRHHGGRGLLLPAARAHAVVAAAGGARRRARLGDRRSLSRDDRRGRARGGGMELAPIKSTRIYEEIVRQVKAMIAEGRLKGGDRLPPERDLAEKFVVSRTSVREALRALESLGLVEIRPGEGTFVREVSVEALIEPLALLMVSQREAIGELFEARRLLEPALAALAASRATPEEIQEMERILEEQAAEIAARPHRARPGRAVPRRHRRGRPQPRDHAHRPRDHGPAHPEPRGVAQHAGPADALARETTGASWPPSRRATPRRPGRRCSSTSRRWRRSCSGPTAPTPAGAGRGLDRDRARSVYSRLTMKLSIPRVLLPGVIILALPGLPGASAA